MPWPRFNGRWLHTFPLSGQAPTILRRLAMRIQASRWRGALCSLNYERLEFSLEGLGSAESSARSTAPGETEVCLLMVAATCSSTRCQPVEPVSSWGRK
jgi:hypothetical protein